MQENQNVLGKNKISALIWKLGLPMIVSMVLQAVYNIVDTVFVVNMGEGGIEGNLALTYAFPIQILIIAVGVGTGVGINVLLSVMMFAFTMILSAAGESADLLKGAFGIYYKIQQIVLFAAFGMSNAIMSVTAFNYCMGDKKRVSEAALWGIADTAIVSVVITALFQIFAAPLSKAFGMAGTEASAQLEQACVQAMRIATIGYVFMGVSVAVQGVLQGLGYSVMPLVLSFMRLILFVLPPAYAFVVSSDPSPVWWSLPLAEVLTAVFAQAFAVVALRKKRR